MRIFLAGATGVIGVRLVPLLVAAGHDVTGTTRSASKVAEIEQAGATGVAVDILDGNSTAAAVTAAAPDLVIHQVTDLPDSRLGFPFKIRALARVRTIGTDHLLAAAQATGARVMAQSIAFPVPGPAQKPIDHLEAAVTAAGGLVVRYGQFYGPGTWSDVAPRSGTVVHIDRAAELTAGLVDEPAGVVRVDDDGAARVA